MILVSLGKITILINFVHNCDFSHFVQQFESFWSKMQRVGITVISGQNWDFFHQNEMHFFTELAPIFENIEERSHF